MISKAQYSTKFSKERSQNKLFYTVNNWKKAIKSYLRRLSQLQRIENSQHLTQLNSETPTLRVIPAMSTCLIANPIGKNRLR